MSTLPLPAGALPYPVEQGSGGVEEWRREVEEEWRSGGGKWRRTHHCCRVEAPTNARSGSPRTRARWARVKNKLQRGVEILAKQRMRLGRRAETDTLRLRHFYLTEHAHGDTLSRWHTQVPLFASTSSTASRFQKVLVHMYVLRSVCVCVCVCVCMYVCMYVCVYVSM